MSGAPECRRHESGDAPFRLFVYWLTKRHACRDEVYSIIRHSHLFFRYRAPRLKATYKTRVEG